LLDLLRQSIYSRLAGYEDVNDAMRLSQDPTFRLIGSAKVWERGAALPSRLHWFRDRCAESRRGDHDNFPSNRVSVRVNFVRFLCEPDLRCKA